MLKLLVTDLDGTLWDGVAGEGNVRPQHTVVESLRALAEGGVLLAACTRNSSADVDALLDALGLPFLVRIYDCEDKPAALLELADQTRIDVADMLLLDDDPLEREQAARLLPIRVLRPHEAPGIERPEQVLAADRERLDATRASIEFWRQWRASHDPEAYLASLNFTIGLAEGATHELRVRQLYERTSKLNLTGGPPSGHVYGILTRSRLDPPGVNGAFSLDGDAITSLVLSCRLSGRQFPEAAVALVLRTAKQRGLSAVRGVTVPTTKNGAVTGLYQRCGFEDGWFDLTRPVPAPEHWTFT